LQQHRAADLFTGAARHGESAASEWTYCGGDKCGSNAAYRQDLWPLVFTVA